MFRLSSKRFLLLLLCFICYDPPFDVLAFSVLPFHERLLHVRKEGFVHHKGYHFSTSKTSVLQVQQKSDQSEYYEVERYRNRAALLESTLRVKMQEMKEKQEQLLLVKSKVQVLEDVTKRLRGQQNEKNEKLKNEYDKERQELEEKLSAEVLFVQEIEKQLNEARANLNMQTKEHKEILEKVQLEMEAERKAFTKQARIQKKQEEELQEKMGALKNELLHLDETLEISQDEMKRLRRAYAAKEDELRDVKKSERQKRRLMEEQLTAVLQERDEALQQLNQTTSVERALDVNKEEERLESIQIAEAAVLAAGKREVKLQAQLKEVQSQYESVGLEKEKLQSDLVGLTNDLSVMKSRVQSMEVSSASKSSLEKQLQDIVEENSGLRGEMDRLLETLHSERLANASNRKVDQLKFDELLEAERLNYEQKLKRLESNASQRRVEDSTKSKLVGHAEVRESPRSGVWKRLRSPRSWFSRRKQN